MLSKWNSLSQVFNIGGTWGKLNLQMADDQDPIVMIKRMEELLEDATKLLQNNKPLINAEIHKSLSKKYTKMHLKVLETKKEARSKEEQRMLTSTSSDSATFSDRVEKLFILVETYHEDVVSASRRAQDQEDEILQVQDGSTKAMLLVLERTQDSSDRSNCASDTDSEAPTPASSKPVYNFAQMDVTKRSNAQGLSEEDDTYQQFVGFRGIKSGITTFHFDSNEYTLSDRDSQRAESSLLNMSRSGRDILSTPDLQTVPGNKPVEPHEIPTWSIESLFESMTKLGLAMAGHTED